MCLAGSLAALHISKLKIMSRLLHSLYQAIAVSGGMILHYFTDAYHQQKTARPLCG
jgi:hypothetical protein